MMKKITAALMCLIMVGSCAVCIQPSDASDSYSFTDCYINPLDLEIGDTYAFTFEQDADKVVEELAPVLSKKYPIIQADWDSVNDVLKYVKTLLEAQSYTVNDLSMELEMEGTHYIKRITEEKYKMATTAVLTVSADVDLYQAKTDTRIVLEDFDLKITFLNESDMIYSKNVLSVDTDLSFRVKTTGKSNFINPDAADIRELFVMTDTIKQYKIDLKGSSEIEYSIIVDSSMELPTVMGTKTTANVTLSAYAKDFDIDCNHKGIIQILSGQNIFILLGFDEHYKTPSGYSCTMEKTAEIKLCSDFTGRYYEFGIDDYTIVLDSQKLNAVMWNSVNMENDQIGFTIGQDDTSLSFGIMKKTKVMTLTTVYDQETIELVLSSNACTLTIGGTTLDLSALDLNPIEPYGKEYILTVKECSSLTRDVSDISDIIHADIETDDPSEDPEEINYKFLIILVLACIILGILLFRVITRR